LPNLNLSNRPVRTRMPGGVAGERSAMIAPYADCNGCFRLKRSIYSLGSMQSPASRISTPRLR
jgi:hypothetical protein